MPRSLLSAILLAAAVVGVALAVTLWGASKNLTLRPLDGVEGDLLFEASRLRDGLVLYTNPAVGALDYGPIPARYYVLYPPLWATFLSLWPADWAASVGRATSCLAWWGVLAWLAGTARSSCRLPAYLAAAFVGGVYSLAEFGGSARPDAVALALAAIALSRAVRRRELDTIGGALFALAAWTKPNVVGMAAGAFVASALVGPRGSGARSAAGAIGVTVAVAGALELASSGAWVTHVFAGAGQPLLLRLLVHHVAARGQFFLCFLALGLWFAGRALTAHPVASAIGLGALATSLLWSLVTFAKIGSAANYWMEPCLAAVVVFANVPPPPLGAVAKLVITVGLPLQALWTAVGSTRATFEAVDANRAHVRLLDRARALCDAGTTLVVADEPGIEVMLDGRLVAHAFTLTHQILRRRLAPGPWLRDLARAEVGCVVTAHDRIERPPGDIDVAYDYFAPAVRAALDARFAPVAESAGWEVYAKRR